MIFTIYIMLGIAPLSLTIVKYRVVRALVAIVVASLLSLSTLYLQTVTQNNLADVYLLGISGASLMGAYLSVLFLGPNTNPYTFALISSIFVSLLVVTVSELLGGAISYVLVGIAFMTLTYGLSSALSLLIVSKYGVSMFYLLFGSLEFVDLDTLKTLFPLLLLNLAFSLTYFQRVLGLWYGERYAASLLNVKFARIVSALIAAISSAFVTSTVGIIPLLGLVAVNMAYRYGWGRKLIFSVILISSTLLLFCDLISRVYLTPYGTLPLSATLGLIGGSYMILILLKRGL